MIVNSDDPIKQGLGRLWLYVSFNWKKHVMYLKNELKTMQSLIVLLDIVIDITIFLNSFV